MATAIKRVVSKRAEKEVSEKVVTVELTEDEAKFWSAICANIGGNPHTSYRSYADSLRIELADAGMKVAHRTYISHGSIYCQDKQS